MLHREVVPARKIWVICKTTKFALLGGQGLRESGVIKWDPFWGNQIWCKFMVLLKDFPENNSALFGLAIYMTPVLVDQLVSEYWFEFLFIVILKGWHDVAPNHGMFSSQIVEIKTCNQKRTYFFCSISTSNQGSLSCFDSTMGALYHWRCICPPRRRFAPDNWGQTLGTLLGNWYISPPKVC